MKLLIAKEPLRRVLRWMRRALLAGGVSLLAYCAYVLADTRIFQAAERRQFEQLLSARESNAVVGQAASSASPKFSPTTPIRGLIGRLEIPRLGISAIVIEGTSATTLRRAVGHIEGTPLPGQLGNIGLSGHRDTFFRPLRNIRRNDTITLTTLLGEYRYRVLSAKVVHPRDVEVLDPAASEILTLVTCYPFYYVGPAPDRFVVRAERVI